MALLQIAVNQTVIDKNYVVIEDILGKPYFRLLYCKYQVPTQLIKIRKGQLIFQLY